MKAAAVARLAVTVATFGTGTAFAQVPADTGVLAREEGVAAQTPAGEVRTWLDVVDDDRIPVTEKPLLEATQRTPIPPRGRRTGLVPRLSATVSYEDNLFFTPTNEVDDVLTVLSPGVSYADAGNNWRLNADYSFEAALYSDNSQLNEEVHAQSGLLSGSIDTSPRTQLSLFEIFRQTRDPTELRIPGAVSGLSRVYSNFLFAGVTHSLTPRMGVGLRYTNLLQIVDDPDRVDIMVHEGFLGLDSDLTARDRLGVDSRLRAFEFVGTSDVSAVSAALGYRHKFSDRLVVEARGGGEYTDADGGHTFLIGGASADASFRFSKLKIEYERGLISAAGVDVLLLEDTVTASVLTRLGRGFLASAELSYSDIVTIDRFEEEIEEISARLVFSYALSTRIWLRLKYTLDSEHPQGGGDITGNKVMFSIVGTL